MSDKLEIPRLRVKKDWHVGLNPDPVDRSHPDVRDNQLIQEAVKDSIARVYFLLHLLFTVILFPLSNSCLFMLSYQASSE